MDKFKLRMKTPTGLGIEYVTVFATSNFERYLNKHNLKYARDITKDYQLTDRFEKLQNNWNELKKWLEEACNNTIYATGYLTAICMTLNKMQELENGNDE